MTEVDKLKAINEDLLKQVEFLKERLHVVQKESASWESAYRRLDVSRIAKIKAAAK